MASTYTDTTGIEKPGTGEQAGTWGSTTNKNFDIIDRALNGVGSISLFGTTHNLTTSDGTVSDGQYKLLLLGGSPSGTNTITILPNDQDKIYLVHNASGENAIFTQGSGTNVTVPNGFTAIIYANGAGSGSSVVDFSALLNLPTFLNDIVEDLTPQLGGDLDVNGQEIVSASNGNVVLNPNGTGEIQLQATTTFVGNAVPDTDGVRDLGTTSVRYANVFADNFTSGDMILDNTGRSYKNSIDGTQGRWRIQEGEKNLYILNELTGKKYKFSLEEV
jgi:hypothetical protein